MLGGSIPTGKSCSIYIFMFEHGQHFGLNKTTTEGVNYTKRVFYAGT